MPVIRLVAIEIVFLLHIILAASPLPALAAHDDAICSWNDTLISEMKRDSVSPPHVARNLAMLHLAVYAAYMKDQVCPSSRANLIAYKVCSSLFPGHEPVFEGKLRKTYPARVPDDDRDFAETCVTPILNQFLSDGSATHVTYVPKETEGAWRRTPPFYRPPELPHWPFVKPLLLEHCAQFKPAGPPPLVSAKFQQALAEVREVGGKNSVKRTPAQTEAAQFWSDFSYTETPVGHWNSIARQISLNRKMQPAESARLFCMLNVALADTALACWEAKYSYHFWRPVTAIEAAQKETPSASGLAPWVSLLNTPNHPEYVSGHSAFSAAASAVLKHFEGTDAVDFSVSSDTLPNVTKTFRSLDSCARESGESRVYGGIHFRFSCEDGFELGRKVAEWTWDHFDQIKP